MTSIPFGGQLTEAEFTRLQWLTTHWLAKYLGWIILAAGAMAMATGGWRVVAEDPWGQAIRAIVPLLFVAFAFIAPRRAIKKAWRQNALIKGPVSGVADESGLDWKSAFVTGRFPWEVLLKHKQTKDMVLLFTAPNSVLYFPKEFFTNEESWQAFRELVARRLGTGK
jgi:hypothetical protein